jgi:hypothetical protein
MPEYCPVIKDKNRVACLNQNYPALLRNTSENSDAPWSSPRLNGNFPVREGKGVFNKKKVFFIP